MDEFIDFDSDATANRTETTATGSDTAAATTRTETAGLRGFDGGDRR